ncbi:MAG: hypothetical protein HZY76_07700 [Anaerolineae bacterium]|nr:MAG: hypothetical protein HZY76_07700 [Anaerolineae bacterium]
MATFNDGRWQEEIERLRVLLNDVEHGAWAFARYNDVSVKKQITDQQRAFLCRVGPSACGTPLIPWPTVSRFPSPHVAAVGS